MNEFKVGDWFCKIPDPYISIKEFRYGDIFSIANSLMFIRNIEIATPEEIKAGRRL